MFAIPISGTATILKPKQVIQKEQGPQNMQLKPEPQNFQTITTLSLKETLKTQKEQYCFEMWQHT